MRYRENLWPEIRVFRVNECVREPVKMIEAKPMIAARPALLVLNQQIANTLVFRQKSPGDGRTGVFRVVGGGIAEFGFSIRVQPVAHAILARTRSSAWSPGTIFTLPERTSAWRRKAS